MRAFPCLLALLLVPPAFAQTTVEVRDSVRVAAVKRFGLNVGARDRWGPGQFLKQLLDNPGFEAGVYGMVVHAAAGSTGQEVIQDFWDTAWNNDPLGIGQPAGFWTGASYEIVYGVAAGRSGTIAEHRQENGRNVFVLDRDGTAPDTWDVLFLRRATSGTSAAGTWAEADAATLRPGSPGRQSLRITYTDAAWRAAYSFYMDSYWRDGDRSAGKMLLVQGNWRLELWARGAQGGEALRARFFREGEADFIDRRITLTAGWQRYQLDVAVAPGSDRAGGYSPTEYHPILGLSFTLETPGEQAWIDDVALASTDHLNPTVFTDAYLARLRELRPGVLRNWSNQLGSTLDVQLAAPWARGTQGYRPHERFPSAYGYSLHEFLELCREVGAEPWYVVPPTFSPEDLRGLVEYLAGPADGAHPRADQRRALGQAAPWSEVFPLIHLEFGNELWGAASGSDPFFGASLLGGVRLGRIAHDRFAILRSSPSFDPARFDLVIGGQAGYPGRQQEIEASASSHDSLALAPYFGVLQTFGSDPEVYYPLFARPFDDVARGRVRQSQDFLDGAGQGTRMSVYEINFHTTDGPAPVDLRNDFLTGLGGGLALPLHLLVSLRDLGVREQCAFSSLGYSFRMANGEYARVWGLLRDLEATGRKRPTWLGVELANRIVGGDLVETVHGGDDPSWTQQPANGVENPIEVGYVQSFAFRDPARLGVALFNLSLDTPLDVRLTVRADLDLAPTRHELGGASIHDDNEDAEAVVIREVPVAGFTNPIALTLPAHSLTVLSFPACAARDIPPVAGLTARRAGGDVELAWSGAPEASGYNVWTVGAKEQVPLARSGGAGAPVAGCEPAAEATCVHRGGIGAGDRFYYQVRGACGEEEAGE